MHFYVVCEEHRDAGGEGGIKEPTWIVPGMRNSAYIVIREEDSRKMDIIVNEMIDKCSYITADMNIMVYWEAKKR